MNKEQRTKIKWVNHASCVISKDSINLITDPWIEGRVFNHSWELLVPSVFSFEDFRDITHIWFSHEHPDHFFPPNIAKIPIEYRRKIIVLFQETMDKKVIEFCKKMEFLEIIELKGFTKYQLSPNFEIINGKVKNDTDSWLHIKTDDVSMLNLNDCNFTTDEITKLSSFLPKIDILFTQFSYANWVGNPNDDFAKNNAGERKIKELKRQIDEFKPKITIPFASFVWFCAKSNFHMNKNANTIERAVEFIRENNSTPIVLYPGDEWYVQDEHDSISAIKKYMENLQDLSNRKLTEFESISESDLLKSANAYKERALSKNNRRKLHSYTPMKIYLTDWQKSIQFSFSNGLELDKKISKNDCDVAIESQNIKYCFDFEWGYNTIQIAGTYEKPAGGRYKNLEEYQWISNLNNNGQRMEGFLKRLVNRMFR